ncbi:MAG: hypothetical protein WB791_02575 [Waddliaceae bacterium]
MSQPLDGHQSRNLKDFRETGAVESRNITSGNFPKSLTRILSPNDVQRRTSSLLTLGEWRASLQEKVIEIGENNPSNASLLSRKIIFYGKTAREREELESFGIQVPDMRLQGCLPGGMEEAAGQLLPF